MLAAGLVGLIVASPLHSLSVLLLGALTAGAGHGLGVLSAQDELNAIAPTARRGEVTSAFIACIYAMVACAVVGSGLLDRWFSLSLAVASVATILALVATATAVWQLAQRKRG